MSKTNTKATINANIKQNGNQEITGQILNSVLNAMVDDYGTQEDMTAVQTAIPTLATKTEVSTALAAQGAKLTELENAVGSDETFTTRANVRIPYGFEVGKKYRFYNKSSSSYVTIATNTLPSGGTNKLYGSVISGKYADFTITQEASYLVILVVDGSIDNVVNVESTDSLSFSIKEINGDIDDLENRLDSTKSDVDGISKSIENVQIATTSGTTPTNVPCIMEQGKTYRIYNDSDISCYFAVYGRVSETSANVTISLVLGWHMSVDFTPTETLNYIRISASNSPTGSHPTKVKVTEKGTLTDEIGTLDTRVTRLEGAFVQQMPYVQFAFEDGIKQYPEEVESFDFSVENYPTFMSRIYAKYDALVARYPEYISRVDLVSYLNVPGLSYPSYASGYKTYMYILHQQNSPFGHDFTRMHRMLLNSGTHSAERPSEFTTYLLAKRLCECTAEDGDTFKLRNAFDIYIIPVLEGYGSIHGNESNNKGWGRCNYNGVNINRNFPVAGWRLVPETIDGQHNVNYGGSEPASEFETKLIIELNKKLNFDILLDLHSNVTTEYVVYTEPGNNDTLKRHPHVQSLSDISRVLKSAYPEYYGSEPKFVQAGTAPSGNMQTLGTMGTWAGENLPFGATPECSEVIAFNNGVYAGEWHHRDDTVMYGINEFIFRNQMLHFCQWVLDYVR